MIYFLNRALILEKEVVKALKKYLEIIRFPEFYDGHTLSITNSHPFARLELSADPKSEAKSLFPAIVVTTGDDGKTEGLEELTETYEFALEPPDLKAEDDGLTLLEKTFLMISPEIVNELREAMDARKVKRLFGKSYTIYRQDQISIEIWAENPNLKNELYDLVRLFVCGFMRDYLDELYLRVFPELKEKGESALKIFDSSIRGLRSNNFNFDYGVPLTWGHITFTGHYIIDQSIIDTDLLVQEENFLMEVINHVKGYRQTTKSRIFGDDEDTGESGGAG